MENPRTPEELATQIEALVAGYVDEAPVIHLQHTDAAGAVAHLVHGGGNIVGMIGDRIQKNIRKGPVRIFPPNFC